MKLGYRNDLDCGHLGRRATIRARDPDGSLRDTLGVLEECDDTTFSIRTKRGDLVRVDRSRVVAAKPIESGPSGP